MAGLQDHRPRLKPGRRLFPRIVLLIGAPALLTATLLRLPWPAFDAFLSDASGARITDRRGSLIALMPGRGGSFEEREDPARIPKPAADIFVKLEDARFRTHPGVDPAAIARALANRLWGRGGRSGASTITMQLARIISPHPRSVFAKLVEAADALRIESRLTKDRILALYLNTLPFGRNARGVGAAAWTYFGADLSTLSPAELLALAIIPRNPTLYDPFDHPDALIAAARDVAARKRLGIESGEIERAVRGAKSGRPASDAPHFARYIAGQLAGGKIDAGDGEVRTTLDLGLNDFIQGRVRFSLQRYAAARVSNAAVVVIENATGAVLGWLGSGDFQDAARAGQVDGVLIRRQSASTIKPFLYASAIQKGWTAATLVPDVPMVFGAADEVSYKPSNFDNRSHGVVRLRTALASSLNVPAVYTLFHVGLASFLGTLADLGFALPPDAEVRYGLGTAIGNAEVSLLELTRAFTVFPRGGTLPDLVLTQGRKGTSRRIFDPFSAWIICNILSDPSARATGFGTHTYFRTDFPAMFKSGTSSEFTNLWCVAATPLYTVGVWAGNFDGKAVINKTGSIVPTQIVTDVLTWLTARDSRAQVSRDFAAPANVVETRICTITGKRETQWCPSTRNEFFRNAAEVPDPCAYHANPKPEKTLLQDSFLGPDESVRILFPVNGQVFYLDQTLRSGTESIPAVLAVRDGEEASLAFDGVMLARGASLSTVTVPLVRGSHSISLTSRAGSDRVLFEVK
ncbi:MAG: transglycosylase domain-containing protein [Spirochaetia bacterium]|jgi:penicillin-binding protein 1C